MKDIQYYLAIDIGASSGRHVLGWLENGVIKHEEIHRFINGIKSTQDHLAWDIPHLWNEIIVGLKKCKTIGKIPISIGVDTWGVDFVLLDDNMKMIGPAVAYRDPRTTGMQKKIAARISNEELYARTGIASMDMNTIYQLMALTLDPDQLLSRAAHLLMIPDYFHYKLCGNIASEYTNATTTGLVNAQARKWDRDLIAQMCYPNRLFSDVLPPGTWLGNLTPEVEKQVGFSCKVVLPGSHDTASAMMAIKDTSKSICISSGTWSLVGLERKIPDLSEASRKGGFTNEGGYNHTIRFLKVQMGMWMQQSIKKELDKDLSYDALDRLAAQCEIQSVVDVNSPVFVSPLNMTHAIQEECRKTSQEIPQTPGEITAVIYNSLATNYKHAAKEIETITNETFDSFYIIGGGSLATRLNELTARYTGKAVITGQSEATAIGNVMAQMIADKVFVDLKEARDAI